MWESGVKYQIPRRFKFCIRFKIVEFFKGAIYNAFVPLTRLPIIYEHIEGASYQPKDEKQNIKDENGYALAPNHPDFKMAPMMKKVGNYKIKF